MVEENYGCGDALLAGIIAGFVKKMSFSEIARLSLAVANAKAMQKGTIFPPAKLVDEFLEFIQVKPV